jgi:hypothetical protein
MYRDDLLHDDTVFLCVVVYNNKKDKEKLKGKNKRTNKENKTRQRKLLCKSTGQEKLTIVQPRQA